MYQNEKEEAKRLQGARKPRKDEELAWVPPRNISKWPDWEEAEGEAEVPEIIVVSDAVEGTFRGLGWRKLSGGAVRKSIRECGSGQKELTGLK